jgi:hypothetical protein
VFKRSRLGNSAGEHSRDLSNALFLAQHCSLCIRFAIAHRLGNLNMGMAGCGNLRQVRNHQNLVTLSE